MIRRPPRSTQSRSSAASDVYKRQGTAVARRYRLLRRWLAATRTGQSQPAPEFDEPRRRLQACNFSPLRLGNLASNLFLELFYEDTVPQTKLRDPGLPRPEHVLLRLPSAVFHVRV